MGKIVHIPSQKEECMSNWEMAKMFREVFKAKNKPK